MKFLTGIVNRYFDIYTGGRRRPIFFDIDTTYPRLNKFQENYDIILKEFKALRDKGDLTQFEYIDQYQYQISAVLQPDKKWKVFIINSAGEQSATAREICPITCSILDEIPDLFLAFFSVLEPRKTIPAHEGPYRGYIRYHLTLQAPEIAPPSMRVKDFFHTWKDRNTLLFDDSWEHEVFNESEEERAVFIVDVLRPMPRIPHRINRWVVNNIIAPYYGKKIIQKQSAILSGKKTIKGE